MRLEAPAKRNAHRGNSAAHKRPQALSPCGPHAPTSPTKERPQASASAHEHRPQDFQGKLREHTFLLYTLRAARLGQHQPVSAWLEGMAFRCGRSLQGRLQALSAPFVPFLVGCLGGRLWATPALSLPLASASSTFKGCFVSCCFMFLCCCFLMLPASSSSLEGPENKRPHKGFADIPHVGSSLANKWQKQAEMQRSLQGVLSFGKSIRWCRIYFGDSSLCNTLLRQILLLEFTRTPDLQT